MTKTARVLFAAALIAAALVVSPARADGLSVISEEALSDRLYEIVVDSPALERWTTMRVLLPTGYDAQAGVNYPVLYLLHGCCGTYKSWSEMSDLEEFTDDMQVLVVMPDAGQGGFYSDWYNNGSGGSPRWEMYHINELIPWVEQTYDVRARRSGRILAGLSMGGMGSFGYASRHPDLFISAAAYSPYIDTNIPVQTGVGGVAADGLAMLDRGVPGSVWGARPLEEVRWRGHNPWDNAENLGTLDLWIRSGDGTSASHPVIDPLEYSVHEMAVSVDRELTRLGIDHVFDDYGHGGHTWDKWQAGLHRTLPRQLALAASDPPEPRAFSYRTIKPSFSVFGWDVSIGRDVLEFARLGDVSPSGFTMSGSGAANVVTAPWFTPGMGYPVSIGGTDTVTTADGAGRLHLSIDLGPSRAIQQYRVPGDGDFLRSVRVAIGPHI